MKLLSFTKVAIVFFAVLAYASLAAARPEKNDLISRVEVHDFDYVAEKVVSKAYASSHSIISYLALHTYILTHSKGLVTCNPGRPKYTFPAREKAIEKNHMELWRHGGDWKAEPSKSVLVNCHKGGGVWFLNKVHALYSSPFQKFQDGVEGLIERRQTPNEITVPYTRIGSMARDVLFMCTKRVRRGRFEVNGENVSDSGFVIIVAGARCPAGGNS